MKLRSLFAYAGHRGRQSFASLEAAQRIANDMAKLNGVTYEGFDCSFCGSAHVRRA